MAVLGFTWTHVPCWTAAEGEYGILTAMVNMPSCSCYSKEASEWCQVTAGFKRKSQMSGTEEKGRLRRKGG